MAALILPSGLVRCFECRYDLTGLPDRGCCPECGQPYTVHAPRNAATTADVLLALPGAARDWRRIFWERIKPSPRTVMMLICVLGTAAVVITLACIALNTFNDRISRPW